MQIQWDSMFSIVLLDLKFFPTKENANFVLAPDHQNDARGPPPDYELV